MNINGTIADSSYYSLGFKQSRSEGAVPNSVIKDYKFNFKSGYQINKKLLASAAVNFTKVEGVGRPASGYTSYMQPIRQWGATSVDWKKQKEAYFRNRRNETWNLTPDRSGPFYANNPYWERYENFESDDREHFIGYGEVKYNVLDWLNLTGRIGMDYTNQFTEFRQEVGGSGISGYTRNNTEITEYNFDVLANYNKSLTQKLAIDGIVGANIRRSFVEGIDAGTNGGLQIENLFTLSNSVNSIPFPATTNNKLGVNGYFASFNVHYNDFLDISLTGRRDKSSTLPEDNNVYYYPSASLAFSFNKFLNIDWLSMGRLRGSWSQVGETAPVHSLQDTYNRQTNFGSANIYKLPSTKNNAQLKPEKIKAWEAGAQLGFIDNKITLQASYYDQKATNLILAIPITESTGYSAKFINSGEIQNRGVELNLDALPIVFNNFSWEISANWSKNINTVNSLAPGIDFYSFGSAVGAEEGGAYGVIRGRDFIYNNGERVVGSDGNYLKTESSNITIGNQQPDWLGGINNTFSYRNLSFSFLIDVRAGGDILSIDMYTGRATGQYAITAGLNQRGNPKRDPVSEGGGVLFEGVNEDGNPNTTYTDINYGSGYGYGVRPRKSEMYDGTYVKLRQATLSYSLPQSLIRKLNVFDAVNLSLVGRDLWIIHKNLPYSDPEQNIGSDGRILGVQRAVYPAFRKINFSVKLDF